MDQQVDQQEQDAAPSTVYPQVPPRVAYALTSLGDDLILVLEGLHAFGEQVQERSGSHAMAGPSEGSLA